MRNDKGQFVKGCKQVFSEKHKENLSKSLMGHPVSKETRGKISEALMGRIGGKEKSVKLSNYFKGRTITQEHRDKISASLSGRKRTAEERKNMSNGHSGKKRPYCTGENNYFWKGGVTEKNKSIRTSLEYRQWRKKVYERDNYTCQMCGVRGLQLNADHIKPFAYYPELRFSMDNGRTLCVDCHKKTSTWGINQFTKK